MIVLRVVCIFALIFHCCNGQKQTTESALKRSENPWENNNDDIQPTEESLLEVYDENYGGDGRATIRDIELERNRYKNRYEYYKKKYYREKMVNSHQNCMNSQLSGNGYLPQRNGLYANPQQFYPATSYYPNAMDYRGQIGNFNQGNIYNPKHDNVVHITPRPTVYYPAQQGLPSQMPYLMSDDITRFNGIQQPSYSNNFMQHNSQFI